MNPNSNYRPNIDGLRAVAVLAVVLHYLAAPLVRGGYIAVNVFFVIDGCLASLVVKLPVEGLGLQT